MIAPWTDLRQPTHRRLGVRIALLLASLWLSSPEFGFRPARGQEPSTQNPGNVLLQGQVRSAADLAALRDAARSRSEELARVTPASPATDALKSAFDAQAIAAAELGKLLETTANSAAREAELNRQIEEARSQLSDWRGRLETPRSFEGITEDEFRGAQAEAERSRNELVLAQGKLSSSEEQVATRKARFEQIANEFSVNQREREAIENRLSAGPVGEADRVELLTNEMRQRVIEVNRDQNPTLLRLEELERELARVRLTIADLRKQMAESHLEGARGARERALDQERRQAEAEANRKRREAARESHPLRRALVKLEGLRAELQGLRAEEESLRKGLERRVTDREADVTRIETRNAAIEERLPKGARLDALRTSYLKDQATRLTPRIAAAQSNLREALDRVPPLLRRVQARGDTLAALLDEMDDDETPPEDLVSTPLTLSADEVIARWHEAVTDRRAGLEAPGPLFDDQSLATIEESWRAVAQEIRDLCRERRALLTSIETLAESDLESSRRAVALLERRRDHLGVASFWLRESWLFSGAELRSVWTELGRMLTELPKSLRNYARLESRPWNEPTVVLAAVLFVSGLGLFLTRRLRSTGRKLSEERHDPFLAWALSVTRALGVASPWILFAIGSTLLTGQVVPSAAPDFFVQFVLGLIATASIARAYLRELHGHDDVDPTASTPRAATKLLRLALVGLVVLVPLSGWCERAASRGLSQFLWLTLTIWIVYVATRVAWRRDVLDYLLPSSDTANWSRVVRAAVRFLWPALVVLGVGIIALEVAGFQHASRVIGTRAILTLAVLVASNLAFLVLSTLMNNWTRSQPPSEEGMDEEHQAWVQQRHALLRRFLNLTLVLAIAAATLLALRWALALSDDAVSWLTDVVILEGRDEASRTRLGDLLRGGVLFALGLSAGILMRELLLVGLKPPDEQRKGARYARGTLAFYFLIGLGGILGLRALHIDLGDLGWLLAPAGVAIGFGMTELLSNFVSGLLLFVERPVRVGDVVTIGDVEGDVKAISIRATVVRTREGISIIIPNRRLIEENVINWSHGEARTRLGVKVGVAYGSDVPVVKRVLLDVAKREGRILERPRPEVSFLGFGESELSFELLVWLRTPDPGFRRRVLSDMNSAIDAAFARSGIEIPFPQRDIHIRSTPGRPKRGPEKDEVED